jgi:xanthine dehydrogenase molybdopterin-binding subunit B
VWWPRRAIEKIVLLAVSLQVGFMNNGEIKAVDVEYYINGGCTPDESDLVNKKYAFSIAYQWNCMCHTLFA